ncbi:YbhB/YbcL family Raf kinase inhibitor-like protein [Mesorhizobium sp. BR1-1-6]|uniref:YbhB/YbcL family Raf kinase inhibitor-like protein n=1 Tax=Mesorhizobium sp. BR1-1-6 TaxID=2876648 RepID=UPI001CD12320|nr:YbhB/YbcL family Raf kinase inhibitor-like protein [Mesorhizobium sp. BR1-1-6]MBZ9897443.1 YbhB/YbcL family Raf kinase inhibitor-like protein [Mesorhizobium sp. BR1-1-6]
MPLTLSSPAFADGGEIPEAYTRDGKNVSPPLKWAGVPDGTKSLVLVVQDPDAPSGMFGHWGVFNISPEVQELPEAESGRPGPQALRQARDDFGNAYYDGPEPPAGHGVHHYHFRLAALDTPNLAIPASTGVERIWQEAQKHLLEQAELVGTYERGR